MNEVILHVGMHKTGSTSIQRSLTGREGTDFLYCPNPIGVPNHSTFLFSLVDSAGQDRRGHARVDTRLNHAAKRVDPTAAEHALALAARSIGPRRLVLSGEGAMLLSASELSALRDKLHAHGFTPRVYAYVRAPVAYATSVFQQHMKNATAPRFDVGARFCDYRERFEKFDQVFGPDRVVLRKFDPAAFTGGCVVSDFCRWTGIAFDGESVRANESLNVEVVRLAYVYHRMADAGVVPAADTPTMRRIVRHLAPIDGPRLRFAPSLLRPFLQQRREDIAWIEHRLGASLVEPLGADRPGDIATEADLWSLSPATLASLRAIVGARSPDAVLGDTPQEVARMLAMLAHASPPIRKTGMRALARAAWRRVAG